MQIFTAAQGAHVYAATEEGLWQSLTENSVNPPPPNWHEVTQTGLGTNEIMWSLSAPLIPGVGGLGVIAGTQSDGGFFLSFEPVDSPCPTSHTTNTTSNCPQIVDTTPTAGQNVTIQNGFVTQRGTWTGTPIIEYEYQWQKCTTPTGGCSNIADAEEVSYLIPEGDAGDYFRIRVTASNPAPSFGIVSRFSAITAATGAAPNTLPGYNQISAPGITVLAPGETTSPQVGDTMYATDGSPDANWFNPDATSYAYRWLRCDGSGSDCNEIPGATSRSYTLQPADGTRDLRVRITGTNGSGSAIALSGSSYDVTSTPAAIADPFPDPDGGPPKSQAPALAGEAYVGETLAGSVGGWKDPTTDFLRRWVRCDAGGNACSYIQKVASTDPEDGSTYVVRDSDVGSTLRMRVTADVNNDLTPDGLDNHLPHAVEIDTPASAVVSFRPVPGQAGGGPPAGAGAADVTAPAISGLRLTKKAFAVGKSTTFKLRLSEPGSVRVVISRSARGRKVGKACRPQTRANRRRKACSYQKTLGTITRSGRPAGDLAIAFNGKLGKRRLSPGSYRATFVVTDAAGNRSKGTTLVFRIVRR